MDLMEEFCALRVWPPGAGLERGAWGPEARSSLPRVAGHEGAGSWPWSPLPLLFFFIFFILTRCTGIIAVMPIDKAAHAVEQLLGPYIGEEHAKRGLVREPRLNRAYIDPAVPLAECPAPDEWRKKQSRVPGELGIPGPIDKGPCDPLGLTTQAGLAALGWRLRIGP